MWYPFHENTLGRTDHLLRSSEHGSTLAAVYRLYDEAGLLFEPVFHNRPNYPFRIPLKSFKVVYIGDTGLTENFVVTLFKLPESSVLIVSRFVEE
ncbi:MAG: hypothetical protein DWI02_11835 [Planctomycetota bacterium]|jgi:ribonuclease BN (tRNA processing enzyme)|nr:MAG: hypothetical protein DWI02_11835 [Planctomycetota bacterium]